MVYLIGVDFGVDSWDIIQASLVALLSVFIRVRRLRSWLRMSTLAFRSMMTASFVVSDTGVGFDIVPVIRSVVKKYRCKVQFESYILRQGSWLRK